MRAVLTGSREECREDSFEPYVRSSVAGRQFRWERSGPPHQSRVKDPEFDGRALRFFVTLDDGPEPSVGTVDDVIESMPAQTPVSGDRGMH